MRPLPAGWAPLPRWLLPAAATLLLAGCDLPLGGRGRGGGMERMSMVEIGERALDTGERLEARGLRQGALEAYERALWAFSYHQRLTGESALLLDDVRVRLGRLRGQAGARPEAGRREADQDPSTAGTR